MTSEEVLKEFKNRSALLEGHFKLSSGLHSSKYLQCALVLQDPILSEKMCVQLKEKLKGIDIDIVIGPAMGGVIIAYELSRTLGINSIFTERVDSTVTLRRGFSLKEGQRCLIAEDVITTGKSTSEVISLIKDSRASLVACACLVDRSDGGIDFGVPLVSLLKVSALTYTEETCPMCKEGLTLVKPGSRVFK